MYEYAVQNRGGGIRKEQMNEEGEHINQIMNEE